MNDTEQNPGTGHVVAGLGYNCECGNYIRLSPIEEKIAETFEPLQIQNRTQYDLNHVLDYIEDQYKNNYENLFYSDQ